MNVFIVSSPFQYMCANEARVFYETKNNILIFKNKEGVLGKKHFKGVFVEEDWDYIIHLPDSGRLLSIPKTIKTLKKIGLNDNFKCLFFSQHECMLTNLIKRNVLFERQVYFDDGTLSLFEYYKYIKCKQSYSRVRRIDDFIMQIQGIKKIGTIEHHESFEMFTIFNIANPSCKLSINNFKNLASKIKAEDCYDSSAAVAFIGEAAVGHVDYISENEYFKQLEKIATDNKKVLYFPHRSESEHIKNRVKSFSNVDYQKTSFPIELEIGMKKLKISKIYGIASTAIYTLSIIYKDIPISIIDTEENSNIFTNETHSYLKKYFSI